MKDLELRHIYDINLFNINDLDVLLHEILKYTRELINAEAGTIYIKEDEYLKFHVFQNDKLSYEDIYKLFYTIKDSKLPLFIENKFLAVDSFKTKKIIMIDDIYDTKEYEYSGTKEFDEKLNYKTHSIITIPLIHPIRDEVLGVVQLLNKKDNDNYINFNEKDKNSLSMFSSFIALSISKAQNDVVKLQRLNEELENANKRLEKKIEREVLDNKYKSSIIFHQSKMSSMGELIGNIAHEWKEPLGVISAYASSLKLDVEYENINSPEFIIKLDRMLDITNKLSGTIDDFETFYNIETIKETFFINSSIYKSLELAKVTFDENNIVLILDLDISISMYGLRNEFTQALLNLLVSIKDSLIQKVSLDKNRYIFIDLFQKDGKKYIVIKNNSGEKILDNNKNIINENLHLEKINNNSKSGLYMTKIIIEKHTNGVITFDNVEFSYKGKDYKGEQFTIILE
ncbi:GAF sensor-containing signal transduction histidine kinase [Arcobacter acticola]|uniref:histidine kinase n=1 Tax=Arcobacter acticola TaxID=1849015 RepID=A0A6M8EXH4_9BACT|nr:GAF domain-containing protein [Arcobacter acticola]QKE29255.1 GAF sensor-containing signal transduction histidine kinase [Arcobacter acticola]